MKSHLTGYRLLWVQVFFDLPVLTKRQRKSAAGFRIGLLELGFTMCQFSVYFRHIKDKEEAQVYYKKVKALVPSEGSVYLLTFTDKQYEKIIAFSGRQEEALKSPEQLALF